MGRKNAAPRRGSAARPKRGWSSLSVKRPTMGQRSEDDQQDCRAYKCDHDLQDDVGCRDAGKSGKPSAQEPTEDADHDVPDQAHASAGEHLAGQESGDTADDDPDDETHHLTNLTNSLSA